MDGAAYVSQWYIYCLPPCVRYPPCVIPSGIPPGETFDYVVPINSSGQHGTYWAHAHSTVRTSLYRLLVKLTIIQLGSIRRRIAYPPCVASFERILSIR